MLFEANKKSTGVAFLLWFFLGFLGGHRFYAGKEVTAVVQLILTVVGLVLTMVLIGHLVLAVVALWWLIDAFLLSGWIRKYNSSLAVRLAKGA